jgi:hypothetical protein
MSGVRAQRRRLAEGGKRGKSKGNWQRRAERGTQLAAARRRWKLKPRDLLMPWRAGG